MTLISQKEAGPIRLKARDAFCKGDFAAAISVQRSLVEATREDPHPGDYLFLGSMLVAAGDHAAGRDVMREGHERWPDEPQFVGSVGICESHLGRWSEAIPWLERAVALSPQDFNLHDCLAWVHGKLGRLDEARRHGERSLVLKDALTAKRPPAVALAEVPVPAFRPEEPRRNVIAFSLFGAKERYSRGALENARIAPHLYPGWRCRFYCDESVPETVRGGLLAAGAEVVLMPRPRRLYEGLFWRFHVANDPEVERYIVRDCDSLLNLREQRAVQAWIESGRHFHVLRDFYSHSDLMLAGLWGGVRGALPELPPLYRPFLEDAAKAANSDQRFLREAVWPTVRHGVCIHDSLFKVLGAEDFPADAYMSSERHVGQDMSAWRTPAIGSARDETGGRPKVRRRKQFVFALATTDSEVQVLAELLRANLTAAEVHARHDAPGDLGLRTPETSLIELFNGGGAAQAVRDFWRRKLAIELYGTTDIYAETCRRLAVAGLVENLDLLGEDLRVDIVALRRPLERIVQDLVADKGSGRGLTLDPAFPRRIVEPESYLANGEPGRCLWYATEMAARAAYYRLLLRDRPNVRLHWVDLESLARPTGAAALLTELGRPLSRKSVRIAGMPGAEAEIDPAVAELVSRFPLEARKRAKRFIDAGRRL